METTIKLFDIVALTEALPEHNLVVGQVGTVVEILEPGAFEVEFSDNDGVAYALLTVRTKQLMILHYRPVKVA